MRDILMPGIVLLIITSIAAACLGVVESVTRAPIEAQQAGTKNDALAKILPSATTFKPLDSISKDPAIQAVYVGHAGDAIEGYVINVDTNEGYSGLISLVVGIDTDGVVTGVNIMSHSETPGLGANATDPKFTNQYIGKKQKLTVVKVPPSDNEIQAITSATITSRAVTGAVNKAIAFFDENLAQGGAHQ